MFLSQLLEELDAGPVLVMAVAALILTLAVVSVHRGVTDRWRKDLEVEGKTGNTGRLATVLARAGYVSRGVAFAVIAFLFARAAVEHDSSESGGLDQAIVRFRDEQGGVPARLSTEQLHAILTGALGLTGD